MDSIKNRTVDVNRSSGVRTRNAYSDLMDPDDCHKKRCLDRYDSSESSDSGVVLLGNGSNCDLSDPYSPSNSSSLSSGFYNEDIEIIKMPPTTSDKNTLTTNWLSFISLIDHDKKTLDDNHKILDTLPSSMKALADNRNNNITSRPKDKAQTTTTSLSKDKLRLCQQTAKPYRRPHQQRKHQLREQDRQQQYQQQLQVHHNKQRQRQRQRQRQYQLQEETGPYICHWKDCGKQFTSGSSALLEHLQISHIIAQTNEEHYICHWINCKVYNKPSCSLSWLERHVLSHGSKWPFRCIVGGCGAFFSTQTLLEKHVNSHFNTVQNSVNNQNVSCNQENVLGQQHISEETDTTPAASVCTSTRCNRVTRMNQNNSAVTVAISNSTAHQVSSASSATKSNVGSNSYSSISGTTKTKLITPTTNAMITAAMTTITTSTSTATGNATGASMAPATKMSKKSYKRVRLRRQIPYSVRTFDYFDERIMGIVEKHLAMNYYPMKSNICQDHCHHYNRLYNQTTKITRNNNNNNHVDSDSDDEGFIELRSLIKGRMTDSHGTKSVLLQWIPENILPDEWVLENQMENYRTISTRTYQSLLKRKQLQSSSNMKATLTNTMNVSSSARRRKYPKRYCSCRS